MTLVLLFVETNFLTFALPETRGMVVETTTDAKGSGKTNGHAQPAKQKQGNSSTLDVKKRIQLLKTLRRIHFLFLGLFSGMEFTLTFLTYDCA